MHSEHEIDDQNLFLSIKQDIDLIFQKLELKFISLSDSIRTTTTTSGFHCKTCQIETSNKTSYFFI